MRRAHLVSKKVRQERKSRRTTLKKDKRQAQASLQTSQEIKRAVSFEVVTEKQLQDLEGELLHLDMSGYKVCSLEVATVRDLIGTIRHERLRQLREAEYRIEKGP